MLCLCVYTVCTRLLVAHTCTSVCCREMSGGEHGREKEGREKEWRERGNIYGAGMENKLLVTAYLFPVK